MPGDYSRNTFIPNKKYSGVLMQQGRVQLDADWNEQIAIQQYRDETEARDVIGPCGVPQSSDGFKISELLIGSTARDLLVSNGRIYVDGLLCELASELVPVKSFVPATNDRAVVTTLIADGRQFEIGQWVEMIGNELPASPPSSPPSPAQKTKLLQILDVDLSNSILKFSDSISEFHTLTKCAVRRVTTYLTQTDYPSPEFATPVLSPPASPPSSPPTGNQLTLTDGTYVVFVEAWHQEIGVLEDGYIREKALGGPDTTKRLKNICQVRLLAVTADPGSPPIPVSCKSHFPEWDSYTAETTGTLIAKTKEPEDVDDPCRLPPAAGYTGLENQLYRVQVHKGGPLADATFKWSRENASVETKVIQFDAKKVIVSEIGKDEVLSFRPEQWVEFVDDEAELNNKIRPLVQIESVNPATNEITMKTSVAGYQILKNPRLRRWDQVSAADADGIKMTSNWTDLEYRIQVQFSEGNYRPGDFWLVAARTVIGEIEWPPFAVPNTKPIAQPPAGVKHHYCKLALLTVSQNGAQFDFEDCRELFPSLTELTSFFYLGGDGQEAMPGEMLPQLLEVGVANGEFPVEGATIQFTVTQGGGVLTGVNADGTVLTGINGVAACNWQLDGTTQKQQVQAILLDAGHQIHLPVHFNANPSVASNVAYFPTEACPDLKNAKTVQAAIDTLCARPTGEGCKVSVSPKESLIEVIKKLSQQTNDICICLMPGDHVVSGNLDFEKGKNISISGCGRGTRVKLEGSLRARSLRSFTFRNLELEGGPLLYIGCNEVTIDSCYLQGVVEGFLIGISNAARILICDNVMQALTERAFDRPRRVFERISDMGELFARDNQREFLSMVDAISVDLARDERARVKFHSQLKRELAGFQPVSAEEEKSYQLLLATMEGRPSPPAIREALIRIRDVAIRALPGTALALGDGDAATNIENNEINGTMVLYGDTTSDDLRNQYDFLDRLKGKLKLSTSENALYFHKNRITKIGLGIEKSKQIIDAINTGSSHNLDHLYDSIFFTENIVNQVELVSGVLMCNSNYFPIRDEIGAVIARSSVINNNHGTDIEVRLFSVSGPRLGNNNSNLLLNLVPLSL